MADIERLLLKPEEVAVALGLGRTRVYELLASEAIASVRVGRSRRVPAWAVAEFAERLAREQGVERNNDDARTW